jgi:hypothetical protein
MFWNINLIRKHSIIMYISFTLDMLIVRYWYVDCKVFGWMGAETLAQVLKEEKIGVSLATTMGKWMPWACERAKGFSQVWSGREIGARWHEGCTKVGWAYPKGNDDWWVHEFFWVIRVHEGEWRFIWVKIFLKGRKDLFGHMGSRRGTTPPKDAAIYDGDLSSPYKKTRSQKQGRQISKTRRERALQLWGRRRGKAPSRSQVTPPGRNCVVLRWIHWT